MKPHNCHPLLWGLTQVLGIKATVIHRETEIDTATLTRISQGLEPTDSQKELFLMMLEECLTQIGRINDKDYALKLLNQHRKKYLNYIISQYKGGLI